MSDDEDTNNNESEESNSQESGMSKRPSNGGLTPAFFNFNQIIEIGEILQSISKVHQRQVQEMYDVISTMRLPVIDMVEILQQAFANIRNSYPFIHDVDAEDIPGMLDKIEDAITVIPEDIDESPEQKQLRLEKTDEILDIIATLRADYESATPAPEETASMSFNNKWVMVFGQTFRNREFYMTDEYMEMMELWNSLYADPTFDLAMEVLRGNTDAIRLWKLFGKANNIHTSSSDDPKTIQKEVVRAQGTMDILASEEAKSQKEIKRRGANRGTIDKINRLAEYRQESIDQRGVIPSWISSCQQIGIDSRIVIEHSPELREKWDDKAFRWKGFTKG